MKNSEISKYSHINHWSNQLEFKKDYKYLEFFFWKACKNLTKSLIQYKQIETTDVRAKALKKFFEPLITIAKEDTVFARRKVFSILQDRNLTKELFSVVSKPFVDVKGGYLQILKKGKRRGDGALISIIRFSQV